MPAATRNLPAGQAKAIVRRAMVRANARPGYPRVAAARIARFAGADRVVANVTTTLAALVSDGDATTSGGAYVLTNQGLTNFRHHPSPRHRRTA